jgi:hypothetical protein
MISYNLKFNFLENNLHYWSDFSNWERKIFLLKICYRLNHNTAAIVTLR